MKALSEQWEDFRIKVIPPTAPPVQLKEMRNAFYAGAICFYVASMEAAEHPEDVAVGYMGQLYDELKAFEAEVVGRCVGGTV
jgi:hypothetical protein